MREHRSLLGLDEEHTFLEKLGLFLSALFLGPLLALLLFAGVQQLHGTWRSIALACCEALAVFWVCLLVFIWWRPPWFRRLYVSAERKAVFVVSVVGLCLLVYIGAAIIIGW